QFVLTQNRCRGRTLGILCRRLASLPGFRQRPAARLGNPSGSELAFILAAMPLPRVFARLVIVGSCVTQVVGCSGQPIQSASAATFDASPEQIAARIREEVVNRPQAELRALYESGGRGPLWI